MKISGKPYAGTQLVFGVGTIGRDEAGKRVHLRYAHDKSKSDIANSGRLLLSAVCCAASAWLCIRNIKSCAVQWLRVKLLGR